MEEKKYHVLAYYCLTPLTDPHGLIQAHKEFFGDRDAAGRIYISEEGINGQMSAAIADSQAYQEWLTAFAPFSKVVFKIHLHHENVFPRMTVKYRKQLVGIDEKVDPKEGAEPISPKQWKAMLEAKESDTVCIDVRNDYEWKIGHFEGSELPPCKTFREFVHYVQELKKRFDPEKTKVMMCCTGGIRCEIFSPLMRRAGFQKLYQLEGGIIGYGLQEGSEGWRGKLFVFDDRLSVPIAADGKEQIISSCQFCSEKSDLYHNCANMECNELFLSCLSCSAHMQGCCSQRCLESPKRRLHATQSRPKPFRRKQFCEMVQDSSSES